MPGHVFAFSDRCGGVSTGHFAEANLSLRVGDDPASVSENRQRLLDSLGLPRHRLLTTRQVHGATVVRVSANVLDVSPEPAGLPVDADGMVTTARGVALLIGAADCVPLVLVDADTVGVLHIGWRGLLHGIVEAGMDAMVQAGARPASTRAVLGPAIGPCHYPVSEDLRDRLTSRYVAAGAVTLAGAPAVDLPGATAQALAELGVAAAVRSDTCTYESSVHFSSRRDGSTGCQGGVVALL